MATQLQLRKGTTTEHSTFVGADGEVTVDTTKKALVLHDGVTAGGKPLPTLESGKIPLDQLSSATTSSAGIVRLNNTITSASASDALTAAQGKILGDRDFGIGQTWKDLTESRVLGTTYTNTTGKPIVVCVRGYLAAGQGQTGKINGETVQSFSGYSSGLTSTVTLIVPPSGTYSVSGSKDAWWELK